MAISKIAILGTNDNEGTYLLSSPNGTRDNVPTNAFNGASYQQVQQAIAKLNQRCQNDEIIMKACGHQETVYLINAQASRLYPALNQE